MRREPEKNKDMCDIKCDVRTIHREVIEKARTNTPAPKKISRLANLFKALGDQNRLMILIALTHGEMCVCDLAAFLDASESSVSHQLRKLRDLGVVTNRREGQVLYYSIIDEDINKLIVTII